MNWLLASVLILHPVMDEPSDLRVVAAGVEEPVEWELDGRLVATTGDREAASFPIGAGTHQLVARTDHEGAWEVMARPDPQDPGTATYVPAWTARHVPTPAGDAGMRIPAWAGPVAMALAAVVYGAWPRKARESGAGVEGDP